MTICSLNTTDKRKFPRFTSKDSCAVMLTPGHIMSYCLVDISKAGMAFCYDGKANESKLLNNVTATFFTENAIAADIAVRVVSDTETNEVKLYHPSEKKKFQNRYLRRCGIKFSSLSQAQEDTINKYIQILRMNGDN